MGTTNPKAGARRPDKAAKKPLRKDQDIQATTEEFRREGMGVAAKE